MDNTPSDQIENDYIPTGSTPPNDDTELPVSSPINLEASSSDFIPSSDSEEDLPTDNDYGLCTYYICTSSIIETLPPGLQRNIRNFCCNTACIVLAVGNYPCTIQTHCHCYEKVHTLFCSAWQQYASKVSRGFFI
ncbi:MAG: hypothetical protein [psittacine adenovirus 7]|uniref:Uncharacterized protein n=1 Tax=psittacine adenovirus 7 TaxID=2848040 RepID=A0A6B9LIF2_9ADEN|nr:MAG: hypothetical protein QKN13_gp24 [psittacine adenovirus 7]QHB43567.1 MAG: hypothetical protein [psittacine adenovirus 7]